MSSSVALTTEVDLVIRATDVPSYDLTSPSDPMVVVYYKRIDPKTRSVTLQKVGRTEPIKDNANPVWSKKVVVDYQFEKVQDLRFVMYDIDDINHVDDLNKQELIGYCDVSLGQIMSSPHGIKLEMFKESSTTEKHKKMRLIIQGVERVQSRLFAIGSISGIGLSKHGLFSKDDTSLEFVKITLQTGATNVFYQSPTVYKNQDPHYQGFEVGLSQLFNGIDDLNAIITLRVVRVRRNSYNERVLVGQHTCKVSDLLQSVHDPPKLVQLENMKKKKVGQLKINFFKVEQVPTFLDYVSRGLQFRLATLIDFTASNQNNGGVNLHRIDPRAMNKGVFYPQYANEYQKALRAVGDVLASYTKTNSITALGYGANVSIDGKPRENHYAFPLTLNSSRKEVASVDELLYAYDYALKHVELSGPTFFEPGIRAVTEISKVQFTETYQCYTILLIITDGLINDQAKTIEAVIASSSCPMCIVICGVGGNTHESAWESMSVLDGDEERLTSPITGQKSVIDNVQFFAMSETGGDFAAIQSATLKEIPEQFVAFARYHKIKPMELPSLNRLATGGDGDSGYSYNPPTQ